MMDKEVVKSVVMTIGEEVEFVPIPQEGTNLGLTGFFQQVIA